MRTIRISDEVWEAIAARGKFGETENDVLERILGIPNIVATESSTSRPNSRPSTRARQTYATVRMSAEVRGKVLYVSFADGPSRNWQLSERSDKPEIRRVRDEAVTFAKQNGASFGQQQAVKKALTDAEYWLAK